MRKQALILCCVLAMGLIAGQASAQDASETHSQGSMTFDVAASITSVGGDDPSYMGLLSLGYFFADQWEVAVFTIVSHNPGEDNADDTTVGFVYARLAYYFVNETICVPYVGVQAGGAFGDASGGVYGPLVGVEFLIRENVALYLEYNALWTSSSGDDDDDITHMGVMGVRYFF